MISKYVHPNLNRLRKRRRVTFLQWNWPITVHQTLDIGITSCLFIVHQHSSSSFITITDLHPRGINQETPKTYPWYSLRHIKCAVVPRKEGVNHQMYLYEVSADCTITHCWLQLHV